MVRIPAVGQSQKKYRHQRNCTKAIAHSFPLPREYWIKRGLSCISGFSPFEALEMFQIPLHSASGLNLRFASLDLLIERQNNRETVLCAWSNFLATKPQYT